MIHWFNDWFTDSLIHCLIESVLHCFVASLIYWFIDSLIHWLVGSLIQWFIDWLNVMNHWFIDLFSHLCMDSFMSFHWHLNNRLLIRWCISHLKHFVASASRKLSYRLSSLHCCFVFSKPPPRGMPDTTWYQSISVIKLAWGYRLDMTGWISKMPQGSRQCDPGTHQQWNQALVKGGDFGLRQKSHPFTSAKYGLPNY